MNIFHNLTGERACTHVNPRYTFNKNLGAHLSYHSSEVFSTIGYCLYITSIIKGSGSSKPVKNEKAIGEEQVHITR